MLWPHRAAALAWSEGGKEGFLAEVVFKLRLKSILKEMYAKEIGENGKVTEKRKKVKDRH